MSDGKRCKMTLTRSQVERVLAWAQRNAEPGIEREAIKALAYDDERKAPAMRQPPFPGYKPVEIVDREELRRRYPSEPPACGTRGCRVEIVEGRRVEYHAPVCSECPLTRKAGNR